MPRIGIPKQVREKANTHAPAKAKANGQKGSNPPAQARHVTPSLESDDSDRARRFHKKAKIRVCPECRAISTEKRWYYDARELKQFEKRPASIDQALCPGCIALHKKMVGGFVDLKGEWDEGQKRDLMNLIARVAQAAQKRNPTHRLLKTEERRDGVYLETTTNRLAETIGRDVHRAFPGALTMQWPKDDPVVRISYERRMPVAVGKGRR